MDRTQTALSADVWFSDDRIVRRRVHLIGRNDRPSAVTVRLRILG